MYWEKNMVDMTSLLADIADNRFAKLYPRRRLWVRDPIYGELSEDSAITRTKKRYFMLVMRQDSGRGRPIFCRHEFVESIGFDPMITNQEAIGILERIKADYRS